MALLKPIAMNESSRRIGESHHRSKLTEDHVALVFQLDRLGLSAREIALKLDDIPGGVAKQTVLDVLNLRTWSHVAVRFKHG